MSLKANKYVYDFFIEAINPPAGATCEHEPDGPSSEHWLFDLDGCLVDSFDGTSLRPLARELLESLRAAGFGVDIWSAGGADYATRVATRVGIVELIGTFWTKERGPGGKWGLPPELIGKIIVCVDDQPDGVPYGVEKISVFPYLGPNPHDQVLRKVLDRVLCSGHA